jgi:protein-tyrosine phosphatase
MSRVHRYRICFVCSGNICRSPTAELVTRRLAAAAGLGDLVEVDSAGLGDWHVGDDADPRALRALAARGYDTAGHCARQFQPADFAERDLVVALDRGHYRALRMLAPTAAEADAVRLLRSFDPAAGDDLEVPDPYYGGPADFEHALDLVEAACRGLLDEIRPELGAPARPA